MMARQQHHMIPIICPSCKKAFHPRTHTTVYCSNKCRIKGGRRPAILVKTKTCSKCKTRKPAESFHGSSKNKDGLQSWCRSCLSLRDRTVRIEYKCEECGKPLVRTTPKYGKRVFDRDLCPRCIKHAVMSMHGGRTANWTGSDHFAGSLINGWRSSAKRRGHRWNLTKEDLDKQFVAQGGICALSGVTMIIDKSSPYRPSLDRIDSALGYDVSNIQFVCSVVNIMKNKLPENLFIHLCSCITRNREGVLPTGVEKDGIELVSDTKPLPVDLK